MWLIDLTSVRRWRCVHPVGTRIRVTRVNGFALLLHTQRQFINAFMKF